MNRVSRALVVMALAVLAGCGALLPGSTGDDAPDGWTLTSTTTDGGTVDPQVAVPDGWDLRDPDVLLTMTAQIEKLEEASGADPVPGLRAEIDAGSIQAVLRGDQDGYECTVTLTQEVGDVDLAGATSRRALIAELAVDDQDATDAEYSALTVPTGDASVFGITVPEPGPDLLPVQYVEVVTIVDGTTYVFAGSAPLSADRFRTLMTEIATRTRLPDRL